MSIYENSPSQWLRTAGVLAGAFALYIGTALFAVLLSGSAVIGAVLSNTVIFAAGLFWLRTQSRRGSSGSLAPSGTNHPRKGRFWTLVGASLVLCWLVGQAASAWLYSLVGSPEFDQHTATKAGSSVVLMMLVVLVLAPMGEEMLMRGLAYSRLRRHMPPLAAALATSLVFSLLHMNLVQIVATLPLGILLAAVYEQTGRLRFAIGLHVIFNLLSVIAPVTLVASLGSLSFVLIGGSAMVLVLVRLYVPYKAPPAKSVVDLQESVR